jgi:hypothetical protein
MHINVVVIGHVDSGKSTTTGKQDRDSIPPQNIKLTYNHRPLDLQVRWNRQAYHREVREGKQFDLFVVTPHFLHLIANFAPRWGRFWRPQSILFFLRPDFFMTTPPQQRTLLPNYLHSHTSTTHTYIRFLTGVCWLCQ